LTLPFSAVKTCPIKPTLYLGWYNSIRLTNNPTPRALFVVAMVFDLQEFSNTGLLTRSLSTHSTNQQVTKTT